MDNQEFQKFLGLDILTLSEAMQKIDANSCGILFIIDANGLLIGSLSDGDVRRFLLSGGKMDDLAVRAVNKGPKVAKTIDEAKALYHKKYVVAVPLVNPSGKVEGVYTEDDILVKPRPSLNIPVVINAGGRGTRLEPFTKVLPKPLIPVGEYPIIEHIIREYQSYNCNNFHIIINYKRDLIKAYFADSGRDYDITWYEEKEPLGTGGGLSLLRGRFDDTFFFANCDALLVANYESMVKFHKENRNVITMICAYKNYNIPYGVVEMGLNGAIEKMKEKPLVSFLANTGIYIVEPEVVDDLENNVAIGFPEIIERERNKGKKVAVFPVSENDWMDMGQLSELEKMRIRLYGE